MSKVTRKQLQDFVLNTRKEVRNQLYNAAKEREQELDVQALDREEHENTELWQALVEQVVTLRQLYITELRVKKRRTELVYRLQYTVNDTGYNNFDHTLALARDVYECKGTRQAILMLLKSSKYTHNNVWASDPEIIKLNAMRKQAEEQHTHVYNNLRGMTPTNGLTYLESLGYDTKKFYEAKTNTYLLIPVDAKSLLMPVPSTEKEGVDNE